MYVLEVKNLSLFGKEQDAFIQNLSFRVRKGEGLLICAENQAFRELLAGVLAGSIDNIQGEVLLDGEEFSTENPQIRQEKGLGFLIPTSRLSNIIPDIRRLQEVSLGYLKLRNNRPWNRIPWVGGSRFAKRISNSFNLILDPVQPLKVFMVLDPHQLDDPQDFRYLIYSLLELKNRDVAVILLSEKSDGLGLVADKSAVVSEGHIISLVDSAEKSE